MMRIQRFKIALLGFGVMIFMACNDGAKKNHENADAERDQMEENRADSSGTVVKDEEMLIRTQDMTALYAKLNMSDDQIERFENDYKQKLNIRTSDNIVDHNLIDLQMDESLKNVLTPEQYATYQQWKKEK